MWETLRFVTVADIEQVLSETRTVSPPLQACRHPDACGEACPKAPVGGEGLDHGGVIASLRTDCGLLARIDTRLGPEAPERITPGDAVAALRLHGLGLAHRPWSVTPPLVAGNPRERWWREGLEAARCTRVQRGRPRGEAAAAGGHLGCEALALAVWAHAGRDRRGHPRDTTRVALPGAYVPARDAPARRRPRSDAQDHRPDLPQAVVDRLVCHDGGNPVVRQRGAGHPADPQGCRKRAAAVIRACQDPPRPRDRVAAAPRAGADTATPRAPVGVSTRLPAPLTWVSQVMGHARQGDPGPSGRATPRDQPRAWGHEGRAPRWRVGSSPAAVARADAPLTHATARADAALTPPRGPRPSHAAHAPQGPSGATPGARPCRCRPAGAGHATPGLRGPGHPDRRPRVEGCRGQRRRPRPVARGRGLAVAHRPALGRLGVVGQTTAPHGRGAQGDAPGVPGGLRGATPPANAMS